MRELNMTEMSEINGGVSASSIIKVIVKTLPYIIPILPCPTPML